MAGAQPTANGVMNGVAPGPGTIVPVSAVRDALPAPDLGGLTIESQTNAIGLIHPPPDIRAIVDKTAQFVAKSGTNAPNSHPLRPPRPPPPPPAPGQGAARLPTLRRSGNVYCRQSCCPTHSLLPADDVRPDPAGPEFEKHILAKESENVKFNFLKSTDPYRAYYEHRVSSRPAALPHFGASYDAHHCWCTIQ